ncbi:telomerase-binding protein EST1A protein [Seiridium cupressi]
MAAKDITTSFTSYLRKSAQLSCYFAGCQEKFPDIEERIKAHFLDRHQNELALDDDDKALARAVQECRRRNQAELVRGDRGDQSGQTTTPAPNLSSTQQPTQDTAADEPSPKRVKSPEHGGRASSPRRSRARASTNPHDPAFSRRTAQTTPGKLWTPDSPGAGASTTRSKPLNKSKKGESQPRPPRQEEPIVEDEPPTPIIKQPETRPISQEQLVAEVKGIYAGLVMVESKCIEVDNAQSSQNEAKLNNEQWQALIALHRTLLHEHHDFFLASQHPSASPALRRLASKYAMPARMWRHGIHSFLELLRHRLPASLEHMLTFIYLAYSMMALLYETVPAFEDTWIECLGDLGRYRMAIEDDDIRDREVWTSVSRHWYSKASDKAPTTGRLYHHLAILARPNALQQLFYYTKSLCVPIPFTSARESIMTLFDPILSANNTQNSRLIPIDAAFVKAQGILFSGRCQDDFKPAVEEYLHLLNNHIGRTTRRWMESGYYIGISTCCALLSYGKEDNAIFKVIRPQRTDEPADVNMVGAEMPKTFEQARYLAQGTYEVVFRRFADPNILPYFHTILVFMDHLTYHPGAIVFLENTFPWKLVSLLLNSILLSYRNYERVEDTQFPRPEKELPRPLPEDFAMKGLLWVDKYYPLDWFTNDKIDDDEKYFEVASMTDERKERILWLACRIASHNKWLTYNKEVHQFGVVPRLEKDLDADLKDRSLDDAEMENAPELSQTISQSSSPATPKNLEENDQLMMDVDGASQRKPIITQ